MQCRRCLKKGTRHAELRAAHQSPAHRQASQPPPRKRRQPTPRRQPPPQRRPPTPQRRPPAAHHRDKGCSVAFTVNASPTVALLSHWHVSLPRVQEQADSPALPPFACHQACNSCVWFSNAVWNSLSSSAWKDVAFDEQLQLPVWLHEHCKCSTSSSCASDGSTAAAGAAAKPRRFAPGLSARLSAATPSTRKQSICRRSMAAG